MPRTSERARTSSQSTSTGAAERPSQLLRVAERLEYGIVGANDGGPSNPAAPFGGVKESGWGREGGDFGIDEYLDVKYVLVGAVDE